MNILITGIHGFVGSNLVEYLMKNHKIYGLDIVNPQKVGIEKTFTWSELSDIPSVDTIIHLAGKAHDTSNQSEVNEYFEINVGLTKKIYDYYLTSSAKKFIFFSSVKAAADVVAGDILTEDMSPAPKGPYGESKIEAEKYIQEHAPAESSGKLVYIIRPCMIHGPGNKGNLNLLYSVVSKGIPWPLGAYNNRRSYASVDNLCYVINGLLLKDIPTGIYQVGDDEALSTNELIQVICDTTGRSCRIWRLNRKLMEVCARLGSILHCPLNSDRLRKLTENYVVSNTKIKQALGIERMPVSARDGLIKTIRSFQTK